MAELTAERVAQHALDLGLVDQREMREAWEELADRNVPAQALLQTLVRRGLLSNWQVDRLLRREADGYFYGEYKVLYLAGAGTFSRVYRAEHRESGDIVAVKVLRSRHHSDEAKVRHFVREGEMGLKLRHPNIVPVLASGVVNKTHYFVMEFVEGQSLRNFIKVRREVTPTEATKFMIDITSAMRYAHKQGITHRDLKLSNVLLSAGGEAKLIDFGLAADSHKPDETLPRTVDYAALEKAGRSPRDDARSDIYFLGVIYYSMLAGKSPLGESRDRAERASLSRFLNVVPLERASKGVPAYICEVANRAMQVDISRRYQTASEFLVELQRVSGRLANAAASSDAEGPTEVPKTVMVVESSLEMQDAMREGLKRSGFRVLMTTDPDRALGRFDEDHQVADCIIFCGGSLGKSAVEAFNKFGEQPHTKSVPAILLMGKDQADLQRQAKVDRHRGVLLLPLKMKQVRAALAHLLK